MCEPILTTCFADMKVQTNIPTDTRPMEVYLNTLYLQKEEQSTLEKHGHRFPRDVYSQNTHKSECTSPSTMWGSLPSRVHVHLCLKESGCRLATTHLCLVVKILPGSVWTDGLFCQKKKKDRLDMAFHCSLKSPEEKLTRS